MPGGPRQGARLGAVDTIDRPVREERERLQGRVGDAQSRERPGTGAGHVAREVLELQVPFREQRLDLGDDLLGVRVRARYLALGDAAKGFIVQTEIRSGSGKIETENHEQVGNTKKNGAAVPNKDLAERGVSPT